MLIKISRGTRRELSTQGMSQLLLQKMRMRCKNTTIYYSFSRNIDVNHVKWLRLEIEVTSNNMLNVTLFDQKNPEATLFLATLDKDSFAMIQAQQNLVIE
jgi:hypothetical protein